MPGYIDLLANGAYGWKRMLVARSGGHREGSLEAYFVTPDASRKMKVLSEIQDYCIRQGLPFDPSDFDTTPYPRPGDITYEQYVEMKESRHAGKSHKKAKSKKNKKKSKEHTPEYHRPGAAETSKALKAKIAQKHTGNRTPLTSPEIRRPQNIVDIEDDWRAIQRSLQDNVGSADERRQRTSSSEPDVAYAFSPPAAKKGRGRPPASAEKKVKSFAGPRLPVGAKRGPGRPPKNSQWAYSSFGTSGSSDSTPNTPKSKPPKQSIVKSTSTGTPVYPPGFKKGRGRPPKLDEYGQFVNKKLRERYNRIELSPPPEKRSRGIVVPKTQTAAANAFDMEYVGAMAPLETPPSEEFDKDGETHKKKKKHKKDKHHYKELREHKKHKPKEPELKPYLPHPLALKPVSTVPAKKPQSQVEIEMEVNMADFDSEHHQPPMDPYSGYPSYPDFQDTSLSNIYEGYEAYDTRPKRDDPHNHHHHQQQQLNAANTTSYVRIASGGVVQKLPTKAPAPRYVSYQSLEHAPRRESQQVFHRLPPAIASEHNYGLRDPDDLDSVRLVLGADDDQEIYYDSEQPIIDAPIYQRVMAPTNHGSVAASVVQTPSTMMLMDAGGQVFESEGGGEAMLGVGPEQPQQPLQQFILGVNEAGQQVLYPYDPTMQLTGDEFLVAEMMTGQ